MPQISQFQDSVPKHLCLAIIVGVWIYLFLVIIGPFDALPISLEWRLKLMLPYSLFFVCSYMLILPLQIWYYKKSNSWNYRLELLSHIATYILCFTPTYFYYKSNWVMGTYGLTDFIIKIYLPTIIILTPILVYIRSSSREKNDHSEIIVLIGQNKTDVLSVSHKNLICVKGADNYVEVYYLKDNTTQMKMMRMTLKRCHENAPQLIKSHRSYLLNLDHFITWHSSNSLTLRDMNLPVTDTYKSEVVKALEIRHK